MKSKFIIGLFIIIGICFSIGINLLFTNYIFIPNPCYYHTNEMNHPMEFFFDFTATDGYHPVPSLFNIIFTLVFGFLLGFVFWKKMNLKQEN